MTENKMTLERFADAMLDTTWVDVEWCDIAFKVKSGLTVEDTLAFADFVASACFADDTNEYLPEIKEFLTRCAVVEYCTNIQTTNDLEVMHKLVWAPEFISTILEHTNKAQIIGLIAAVDEKVKHIAAGNIEMLNKKIDEVTNDFANITNQMEGLFGQITGDEMRSVVDAISNGNFDVEKVLTSHFANGDDGGDDK